VSSNEKKHFKFSGIPSRKNKQNVTKVQDELFPAKFLIDGSNADDLSSVEEELADLHEQMNRIRPKIDAARKKQVAKEQALQDCQFEVDTLKKQSQNLRSFLAKREQAFRKLRDAKESLNTSDDEKEKKELVRKLMNRMSHGIGAIEAHTKQHEQLMEVTIRSTGVAANKHAVAVAEQVAE